MEEVWKDINGFEGLYQISNFGRLKSFKNNPNGLILSNINSKGDYLSVVLRGRNGNKRHTKIHILVAEAFLPPKASEVMQVHHKDGNKQNNHVSNLEWITPNNHIIQTMRMKPDVINGMVRYNKFQRPRHIVQLTLDGEFIAEYCNAVIASAMTGVCQRNILQVASQEEYKPGKTRKQAGGYIWRFKGGDVNEVVRTG